MIMRKTMLALGLAAMVAPALTVPVDASAQRRSYDRYNDNGYSNGRNNNYREWRGNDGRMRCRKSDGTTGLVVGGVAGALLGRTIDTRGDRSLGTLGGAAAGALAGRAIERGGDNNGRRCR
jgi:outer membrane lipoprotein SlyB